jgi:hypothetical protein
MVLDLRLKIEILVDMDTIGGVKQVSDFATNIGINAMLGIESGKAKVCVDLRQGDCLLGRRGKSNPTGGISCVRSDDKMSGFEHGLTS